MKNKLLISFILFISILSIFSFSFASTELEFSDGELYNLPDFSEYVEGKDYCIIYGSNNNTGTKFILVPYNSSINKILLYEVIPDKYSLQFHPIDSDGSYQYREKFDYYYLNSISDDSWKRDSTSDDSGFYFSGGIYCVYSTKDLLDLEGNLVFHQAPARVTIPAIQQVEEIPQVMEQVMKILIPIGLIVFSIGFVIYLTRLVISRVQ